MVNLICSLNVTIPGSMIVQWTRDNQRLPSDDPTGSTTTTLVIENFEPLDPGVYQCLFSDVHNSRWILTRTIILNVSSKFIMKPCMNVTS